jgi:hypothetical protein
MQTVGQWIIENPQWATGIAGAVVYIIVALWKLVRGDAPTSAVQKKLAAFALSIVTGAAGIAATGTWDWGQFVAVVLGALGISTVIHQYIEVPVMGGASKGSGAGGAR